jgi:hypothetical protein
MLRRYIEGALKDLSFAHRKMAFVSGPRQCGKTTLGKMLLEHRGRGAYYNYRSQYQIGETKLLVASASWVLPFFVQNKNVSLLPQRWLSFYLLMVVWFFQAIKHWIICLQR